MLFESYNLLKNHDSIKCLDINQMNNREKCCYVAKMEKNEKPLVVNSLCNSQRSGSACLPVPVQCGCAVQMPQCRSMGRDPSHLSANKSYFTDKKLAYCMGPKLDSTCKSHVLNSLFTPNISPHPISWSSNATKSLFSQ